MTKFVLILLALFKLIGTNHMISQSGSVRKPDHSQTGSDVKACKDIMNSPSRL